MRFSTRWEKTPKRRKALVFVTLGLVAIVAVLVGLFMGDSNESSDAPARLESTNALCSSFKHDNPDIKTKYYHEGLACNNCSEKGKDGEIMLYECENICSDWKIMGTDVDPYQDTCHEINVPHDPGNEFECPENTYFTVKNKGCIADSIEDFKLLKTMTVHLEEATDLHDCFETCDQLGYECGGVSVNSDGTHCFVFSKQAKSICNNKVYNQNVCIPIPAEIQCYYGPVTYYGAKAACEAKGQRLALRQEPDHYDLMLKRLENACHDPDGCYFDGGDDKCRFVDSHGYNLDPTCYEQHGYCCETETGAPTVSPTKSPTEQKFFIPDDCDFDETARVGLDFESAVECCHQHGANLAAITSQKDQDHAYQVCHEHINDIYNDCGCWVGVNRPLYYVDPLDIDSFTYTDGSGALTYNNFEQSPEKKPDNQDDRNEACVHMRPFSHGGWNDLPCDGNCDAKDTKPLPLCRLKTMSPTMSPTYNPTSFPTKSPTKTPTFKPTKYPTYRPTKYPTYKPTKYPTERPTKYPTYKPTKYPTERPTKYPTYKPTKYPTERPTKYPTYKPTKYPTEKPTKYPTGKPTDYPTPEPTKYPTYKPTKYPTERPTKYPTYKPTRYPTEKPTKYPTYKPTKYPTEKPTKYPTYKPTYYPTKKPTTHVPTASPTLSPIKDVDSCFPVCTFGGEEYVYSFTNENLHTPILLTWTYLNPTGYHFIPGDHKYYLDCQFFVCSGIPKLLQPGETYEFRAPASKIVVEYPCKTALPWYLCKKEIEFPHYPIECECDNIEFFEDDFEDYPAILGVQNSDVSNPELSEFLSTYDIIDGSVDIKGVLKNPDGSPVLNGDGDPVFLSNFFSNPCLDDRCIDVDGTLAVQPDEVVFGVREVAVEPSNAFFNRICTLNFFARGNGRCGKLHLGPPFNINDRLTAIAEGCFQFSKVTLVPLYDDLTATIVEGGAELATTTFKDIIWNQDYEVYGVTADVKNDATTVGATFIVDGGDETDENIFGNIGPLIDNIDITCCCPDEHAKYAGEIIHVDQGMAFNGYHVPEKKSKHKGLIGHYADYLNPYAYSLGLGGSITIQFTLGVTHKVRIYEDSYLCCNNYDPEDAMVEVSVDGINFITVATSLKGKWQKMLHKHGDHIRYVDVDLPNGACFKYIRITDTSAVEAYHCDGFDLVAIEVLKPCCPTNYPELPPYKPPTHGTTSSLALGSFTSGVSAAAYGVAIACISIILMLVVVSMNNKRRRRGRGSSGDMHKMSGEQEKDGYALEAKGAVPIPVEKPIVDGQGVSEL